MVKQLHRRKPTKRTPKNQGQKFDPDAAARILRTRDLSRQIAKALGTTQAYVSMVLHRKKNATERFKQIAWAALNKDARDADLAAFLARYPRAQQPEAR